jgi:Antibiotic biosynthesis monooxygenase
MVMLRFKIRSTPDKRDEVMAALAEIIGPARDTQGVINFDIARVLLEPDSFIATAVYEDGAGPLLPEKQSGTSRAPISGPESPPRASSAMRRSWRLHLRGPADAIRRSPRLPRTASDTPSA